MSEVRQPAGLQPRVRRERGDPEGGPQRRRLEFGRSSLSRGPDRAYEQSRRGRQIEEAGPTRRIRRQHERANGRPVRISADRERVPS